MDIQAPFAGRQTAIARIRQHITDPIQTPVPAFIGRRGIGKTALVLQFAGMPTDTHIGVYLPCKDISPQNELDWLNALFNEKQLTLSHYGFSVDVLSEIHDNAEGFKLWFKTDYLPAVFRVIHRARHLVFLVDDAEVLVEAMMRDTLAEDYFGYLNELRHPQCGVVLTIGIAYENRLELFYTITDDANFSRLGDLNESETADALHQHNPEIAPKAVEDIFRATGGQPSLISAFLAHLPQQGALQEGDVKKITPTVYQDVKSNFRAVWDDLNLDERLVLTAIGSLIYADPMKPVTASSIESWLVETDYLLDLTSIHATIRGLDYRELITGNAAQRLTVRQGLLQTWMLENVRLDGTTSPDKNTVSNQSRNTHTAVIAIGIISIMLLLALVFAIASTPRTSPEIVGIPTATLSAEHD
jgi:hypothetical protein